MVQGIACSAQDTQTSRRASSHVLAREETAVVEAALLDSELASLRNFTFTFSLRHPRAGSLIVTSITLRRRSLARLKPIKRSSVPIDTLDACLKERCALYRHMSVLVWCELMRSCAHFWVCVGTTRMCIRTCIREGLFRRELAAPVDSGPTGSSGGRGAEALGQ
jgi:hypothetical protein